MLMALNSCNAFVPATNSRQSSATPRTFLDATGEAFEISVNMPPTTSELQANMKFESILSVPSEVVEVRYKVPFVLNVEPKRGLAVCMKDGDGGEKVGDVLRFTSAWSMGLPEGDGLATTAAAFSGGGLAWRCTMFNVLNAKAWEQVVEALVSNEQVSSIGAAELHNYSLLFCLV
jgi:hypothetical protein